MDVIEPVDPERVDPDPEVNFRDAFVHATIGVSLVDLEGRYLYVNPAYCAITSYPESELRRRTLQTIVHPDDVTENQLLIDRLFSGELPGFVHQTRYLRKDGQSIWVQHSVSLVRDELDRPHAMLALVEDLTGRRDVEETIEPSIANLSAVVNACPFGMMLLALDGTVRLWNLACERIFGWTASEVVGRFLPSIADDRRDEFLASLESVRRGKILAGIDPNRLRKGNVSLEVNLWTVPVADANGQGLCLSMIADVTERKRHESNKQFLRGASDTVGASADPSETLTHHAWHKQSEERQRILAETARAVLEAGLDLSIILDILCRYAAGAVGDSVLVMLLEQDGQTLRLASLYDADPSRAAAIRQRLSTQATLVISNLESGVSDDGRATGIAITRSVDRRKGVAPEPRSPDQQFLDQGTLTVYLRARGQIFGTVSATRNIFGRLYARDDEDLLQELADRAAPAIENALLFEREQSARRAAEQAAERLARLYEEEQNARRRLVVLSEATEAFAANPLDDSTLLATVVRVVSEHFNDGCILLEAADDGTLGAPVIDHPDHEVRDRVRHQVAGSLTTISEGPIARMLVSGDVIFQSTGSGDQFARLFQLETMVDVDKDPIQGVIAIPLLARGKRVAVVGIWRQGRRPPYTVDDLALLQDLADRAALAIDNTRLYQKAQSELGQKIRTAADLLDRETELRLALEAGHMGVWDWNVATGQLRWTEQLESLHGTEPGSFDGTFTSYLDVIHPRDRDRVRADIQTSLERGGDFWTEFRVTYADGSVHWIAGTGRPHRDEVGNPTRMIGLALDITERKRVENAQSVLAHTSRLFVEAHLDQAALLNALCRSVGTGEDDQATIQLVEPGSSLMKMVAVHDPATEIEAMRREMLLAHPAHIGDGLAGQVVLTGKPVFIPQINPETFRRSLMPEHVAYFDRHPLRGIIVVPMRSGGKVIGALTLGRRSAVPFDQRDVTLLQELADRAALAFENTRLYVKERQAREEAEQMAGRIARLHSVTAALAAAATVDQVIEVVMGEGVEALDADSGVAMRLTDDGENLVLVGKVGYRDDVEEFARIPISAPVPVAEAVRRGEAVWIQSRDQWNRRYATLADEPDRHGHSAWAAIPLLSNGRVIGAFGVAYTAPRVFEIPEIEFAQTLARQAGQALERASLFVAEQRAREKAEGAQARAAGLAEISQQLVEARLDVPQILDIVSRKVAELIGDGSAISLLDPDGSDFDVTAVHHRDPKARALATELLERYPPRRNGSLADRTISTGESTIYPEIRPEVLRTLVRPEQSSYARGFGFSSLAIVPLRARGQIIGIQSVWRDQPGRPYTDDDVRLLQELADRAASAIENARLYAESRAAIRLRDEFLATAAHELKTPLTGLRTTAQLLSRVVDREGVSDPDRLRRLLSVIDRQSEKLAHLVALLLDIARLDGDKLVLEKHDTDLVGLLTDIVAAAEVGIGRHQIHVVATEPIEALVDAFRLEQVVTNLLDNAIKFSPKESPILVEIGRSLTGDATISVTDHGIGIPPERRSVIFDRFSQAHADDYLSGLGLGLFISRQITELHQGTLVAEFPPKGGTRFVIQIPTGVSQTQKQ